MKILSKMSTESNSNIDYSDNLNLEQITISELPNDIYFPEELNTYLKGQIEYLTHKNGMLQKTLSEKEMQLQNSYEKINNLNKRLVSYESFKNDINIHSSSVMSVKIVELSKKLREKSSELESFRTKHSKLQMKLQDLMHQKDNEPVLEIVEERKPPPIDQLQQLQDKIAALNNKLFETKNANLQLKNDLKVANKILQQELGDTFVSIQNISSGTSNWRGRAQQIISLQQKNSELLERLSVMSEKGCGDMQNGPSKTDNRKLIIEQLNKELESVKNELDDTKKKLNGARARVKVLETESASLKGKLSSSTEKNNHDANVIKILTDQIANLEENNTESIKEKQIMWRTIETENKNLKLNLAKEKCIQENLLATIREKESRIAELTNSKKPGSANSVSSSSDACRLHKLEVEVKRLLEFIEVQNERLNLERNLHSETQSNYRKERQKAARLEMKLSRIEVQNNVQKSHSYSKFASKVSLTDTDTTVMSMENLKNNLELAEENIISLQSRLQILQREKELDMQRFAAVINGTANMKSDKSPRSCRMPNENTTLSGTFY